MKETIKTVRPSFLYLSNILSGRVGFSGRIVESSFSTRSEFSGSTSQPDPSLFPKNSNSTRRGQSILYNLTTLIINLEIQKMLNKSSIHNILLKLSYLLFSIIIHFDNCIIFLHYFINMLSCYIH